MALVKEADVFESWEDMDEAQLERQAAEYLASRDANLAVNNNSSGTLSPQVEISRGVGSISMESNAPPTAVRILKRPSGVSGTGASGDNRQRPMRTLLQRQQDYEAARLRILGAAKCPDDAQQIIPNLQVKSEATTNRLQNNKTKDKIAEQQNVAVVVEPNNFVLMQPRLINQPPTNGISLLRTPKGPDHTKGFNLRR